MNKRTKLFLVSVFIFLVFLLGYRLFIIPSFIKYENVYITSFFILYIAFLKKNFGFNMNANSINRSKMLKIFIIYVSIYFIIFYLIGFIFGFKRNALSYDLDKFIINLVFPIVFIVCEEIIRWILLKSLKDNKTFKFIVTTLLVSFEIFTTINGYDLTNYVDIYLFISLSVLPSIIKNILMNYLCISSGIFIPIIYRIVMDLYVLIVPIIPNTGDYLNSLGLVIFPLIFYIGCNKEISKDGNDYSSSNEINIIDIGLLIVAIFIAALVSGFFNYHLVSIGSNSMNPTISKGDLVLIKKYNDINEVKENDIVYFLNNNTYTVHRIIKKEDNKFVTKGDFNNVSDGKIDFNNIEGKVIFNIPYLGYPSVWLKEQVGG